MAPLSTTVSTKKQKILIEIFFLCVPQTYGTQYITPGLTKTLLASSLGK